MELFDPYLTFRLVLALIFSGFIVYDLIALYVWYHGLPRWVRRIVLLKLLKIRSRALKVEFLLMGVLVFFEGWLMTLLLRWD
jgi:hypothetical protein